MWMGIGGEPLACAANKAWSVPQALTQFRRGLTGE